MSKQNIFSRLSHHKTTLTWSSCASSLLSRSLAFEETAWFTTVKVFNTGRAEGFSTKNGATLDLHSANERCVSAPLLPRRTFSSGHRLKMEGSRARSWECLLFSSHRMGRSRNWTSRPWTGSMAAGSLLPKLFTALGARSLPSSPVCRAAWIWKCRAKKLTSCSMKISPRVARVVAT